MSASVARHAQLPFVDTRLVAMLFVLTAACGGGMAPPGDSNQAVTPAAPAKAGRLPPALIQRIVRAQAGFMHDCYEKGLTRDANLSGQIRIKFVVSRKGSVQSTESIRPQSGLGVPDGGAPIHYLDDASVVACVTAEFAKLTFPPPDGGLVTVVYPINFSPADRPDAGGLTPTSN
jgi:hypothetical protein